ncbi:MAG: hypothetical protein COX62_03765 [Deltaproteobacteria bacterium CG_4_10_14_0_2_um_filter_43_8]|nr:MAG: hypothetical protein COV43_03825 [Deltaproteobacteria bacterium CG11_big_fil_rev_8_21_14_0_20_42_23]PJA20935.1 MAG: hypothetical protein COX62_03765 [Deltaproteobacteria bacterium CG_4_10_14_0_2_um_filter_43_8]PJC63365.1 MAG: hypothetical protein CO021_09795 [Deltaproteobacteria bacterium CG_4_9_14_0_2_um_filter_42_21]
MKKKYFTILCLVLFALASCSGDSAPAPVVPPAPGISPNDLDGDGIPNNADNCPLVSNADQANTDGDATGDACDEDENGDVDGDGLHNGVDNCPNAANADQLDLDADGIGDVCDDDMDGDGIANIDDDLSTCANAAGSDAHIFRGNVTAATLHLLSPEQCLIEGSIHLTGVVDILKWQQLEKIGKVTQNINIHDNNALVEFKMPYLKETDNIFVTSNPQLEMINLQHLTSTTTITLQENSELASVDFTFLTQTDSLILQSNSLTDINFPSLLTANLTISDGNDEHLEGTITSINLPLFSTGSLTVRNAEILQSLSAPSLTEANNIYLHGLINLEQLDLSNLQKVNEKLMLRGYMRKLKTLNLSQLERVNGLFKVYLLTELETLSLDKLNVVTGSLSLIIIAQVKKYKCTSLNFCI